MPIRLQRYVWIVRNLLFITVVFLFLLIYKANKIYKYDIEAEISIGSRKYVLFKEKPQSKFYKVDEVKKLISQYNEQENILNLETYGPVHQETTVFVIYVRKFTVNFKYLLASLSRLKGIEDTLVIFSHSFYDENINELIRSIDFCRVMQIYYPYSVQLYRFEFPGYQTNDCPHDMNMAAAESMNCTGAFTPDIHGRYRNPLLSEYKHHWWWTSNKVFENLKRIKNHKGLVIFLEDDYFFQDDFLYMVLYMKNIAENLPHIDIISLAPKLYSTVFSNESFYRVDISSWNPNNHGGVIAFDLPVWNSIASHYDLFCLIDEYSWSLSLLHLSLNRRDGWRYRVISSVMPRAFKTSLCGLFRKLAECDVLENVYQVLKLQSTYEDLLFPPFVEVFTHIELEDDELLFDYAESNGGWNDPRDKKLCVNMTISKIKKVILDMENEFELFRQ